LELQVNINIKKDRQFYDASVRVWHCSWHEIGYYDLPAMIDYILEKTGYSELYYIGYSQGTTVFFVMGSEKPEYNAKVKGMISLAPAVFLSNQRSPLITFLIHIYDLLEVIQGFVILYFVQYSIFLRFFSIICLRCLS